MHYTPGFNCAEQIKYYAETENRLNLATPGHEIAPVVDTVVPVQPVENVPVVNNVVVPAPAVNEHVSSEVSSKFKIKSLKLSKI